MLRFKQFIHLLEAQIDDYKKSEENSQFSTDHDSAATFHTPKEIIDHFHSFNKSGNVNSTKWVINQYKQGNIKQEDAPRMGELLDQFEKTKTKLPKQKLSQYQSTGELESALNTSKTDNDFLAMTPEQTKIANAGSTTVYQSPNLSVHHIEKESASIAHGDKMPWCTSRKDSGNMYNHYHKRTGNRVYIGKLPHEQYPYRKIIVGVGANEFQDEKNDRIQGDRLKDFITRNPELKEVEPLQGSVFHITKDPKKHFEELIQNDQGGLFDHMDKNPGLYDKEHWDLRNRYKDELSKAHRGDSSVLNSRFRSVLAKLAQTSNNPDVLDHLAQSPHTEVKQYVGSNSSTSKETRKSLFGDVSPLVRTSINLSGFIPKEKIDILKNEKNPEVISWHLRNEQNEDVNHEVVSHHLPKLQEFISKAIANGDHLHKVFSPTLEHGIKYGYVTPDHIKKMGNLLLEKIRKGTHTLEELDHGIKYGYLRMGYEYNEKLKGNVLRDHQQALQNYLKKKLKDGNWTIDDIAVAKKYGYLDEKEHIPKLKDWLTKKLDSGNWNDDDINHAHEHGYLDEKEHIPILKNWLSKKLDSGDWEYYHISNAKKYGYFDEKIHDLKQGFSNKLDSGNWDHSNINNAQICRYFDEKEHIPILKNWLSKKLDSGKWNNNDIENAVFYDYFDENMHIPILKKWLSNKLDSGKWGHYDIDNAKKYGYLDENLHIPILKKWLSNKLDSGKWGHYDIDKAKEHGYLDENLHIPKLKDWLSNKLDSGKWGHYDIDKAKEHGYFDENLHEPKKWLSNKIESGNWNDDDIDKAKKNGYFDENMHIPKLKDWFSKKLDSGNWNHDDIDKAKEHHYFDEKLHDLKQGFSNKLDSGNWNHGDIEHAMKHDPCYFDENMHIPKLKKWLSNKLDSGNWNHGDIDKANWYGYFDEKEHIPKLKDWFSKKLDSGNWNHDDIDKAKEHHYFDEKLHDLKQGFSNKLDSGKCTSRDIDNAKYHGYLDKKIHIPKLKQWLSNKIDKEDADAGDIDFANNLGFLDNIHLNQLLNNKSKYAKALLNDMKYYGFDIDDEHDYIPKITKRQKKYRIQENIDD